MERLCDGEGVGGGRWRLCAGGLWQWSPPRRTRTGWQWLVLLPWPAIADPLGRKFLAYFCVQEKRKVSLETRKGGENVTSLSRFLDEKSDSCAMDRPHALF